MILKKPHHAKTMNDIGLNYEYILRGITCGYIRREELVYLWRGQVIIRSDGRWNELSIKRRPGALRSKYDSIEWNKKDYANSKKLILSDIEFDVLDKTRNFVSLQA